MHVNIWISEDSTNPNSGPYKHLDTIESDLPCTIGDMTRYGEVIALPPFDQIAGQNVIVKLIPSSLDVKPVNGVVHSAPQAVIRIQFSPIHTDRLGILNASLKGVYPILPESGLTIEDVSPLINKDTFSVWKQDCYLSSETAKSFDSIQYALVHRTAVGDESEAVHNDDGDELLNIAIACLALVRPTRRSHAASVSGVLCTDGRFEAKGIFHQEFAEVPMVQRCFAVRPEDVEELDAVMPEFLRAYQRDADGNSIADYEPIRMAVQLYEQAYSIHIRYWKARHILLWSAIEALYGNEEDAVKARIYAFFGNMDMAQGYDRSIYDKGDIPSSFVLTRSTNHTLGELVPLIYAVRNESAHGQKLGDARFIPVSHPLECNVALVEVLAEAATFIIRKTIIGILKARMLDRFKSRSAREEFWLYKYGLNKKQSTKRLTELLAQKGIKRPKGRSVAVVESQKEADTPSPGAAEN